MGELLCDRLVRFVENALDHKIKPKIAGWTDSTITLGWIKSNSLIRDVYVNNRVREIQQLMPPSHWYHCCGLDNPTDLITRGLLAEKLVNNDFWFNSPSNLADPKLSSQDNDNSTAINEAVNHELEDNLTILTVNHELEDNLACLAVQTVTPMFDAEK